jgi:hypothetical protein
VAEESGKGIALVILGIVAIIAVVGLVLLFTGARKAVGEFAVPGVKEYGGAIKGIYDPYSRAFAGRAFEFDSQGNYVGSGNTEYYMGQYAGTSGVQQGGQAYGDISGFSDQGVPFGRGEQNEAYMTYNRQNSKIPTGLVSCNQLSKNSGKYSKVNLNEGLYPIGANVQQYTDYVGMGRSCVATTSLLSSVLTVKPNDYGLAREVYDGLDSLGVKYCCTIPSEPLK